MLGGSHDIFFHMCTIFAQSELVVPLPPPPSNVPNIWEQDTSVIQPFQSNGPPAYKRFTRNSEPFLFTTSKLQAPNPSGLAAEAKAQVASSPTQSSALKHTAERHWEEWNKMLQWTDTHTNSGLLR